MSLHSHHTRPLISVSDSDSRRREGTARSGKFQKVWLCLATRTCLKGEGLALSLIHISEPTRLALI
eukprot:5572102-Alexandrium_andersonii.AAC.1